MKLALALVLLYAAPAAAIVHCTKPDGSHYIGEFAPADCVVKRQYDNSPPLPPPSTEEADAERASVQTSLEQARQRTRYRETLREIEATQENLGAIKIRIARLPVVNPANYPNTHRGWQSYEEALRNRSVAERELYSQRERLQARLMDLRAAVAP